MSHTISICATGRILYLDQQDNSHSMNKKQSSMQQELVAMWQRWCLMSEGDR